MKTKITILILFAFLGLRVDGQFTQQGMKLIGSGAINSPVPAGQGGSVSISADGNTAIVGGADDNNNIGAAWIYTRDGGVWNQQGLKLIGTGAVNSPYPAQQGISVAISGDGNTAIIGGNIDNNQTGSAWIFIRENGIWTQQGNKLVGSGYVGGAQQGISVGLLRFDGC